MSTPQVEKKARAALDAVIRFALDRAKGGDSEWNEHLRSLGGAPLSSEERQMILQHGPPITKGPVAVELRYALVVTLGRVEEGAASAPWAPMVIEDAIREFVNAAKAPVTTSSIFANAMATTKTYASQAGGSETVRCPTCGAPRMDGSESMVCGYCGSAMSVTEG